MIAEYQLLPASLPDTGHSCHGIRSGSRPRAPLSSVRPGDGFCPAPQAKIDDGLINCCAIDAVGLLRSLYLITKYKNGKHDGYKEIDNFVTTVVTVEATGSRDLNGNYDGEDFSGHKVSFECVPGSIKLAIYS